MGKALAGNYKPSKRGKVPRQVVEAGDFAYTQAKAKPKHHEETVVQRPLVRILEKIEGYTGLLTFFHVPNQLLRRKDLRKIFHGLGVRSGVPDLVIPLTGGRTLFIELKFGNNDTTETQDKYIQNLRRLGHLVEVIAAKDSMDAQNQLFDILAKHGLTDFRFVHPADRT